MPLARENVERVSQLAPLQHGVFFEALQTQGSGKMMYQACLELRGPLRPEVMRSAWRSTVARHPALRSSFHYEGLDAPVQVAHRVADPPWRELDWRADPPDACRARLLQFLTQERQRPCDLRSAPLMRLTLIRADQDLFWLVWTFHALVVDGWSLAVVLRDVFRSYHEIAAGRRPSAPLPRPQWEYVAWLRRRDAGGAEEFWRSRLAGIPVPLQLGDAGTPAEAADAVLAEFPVAVPEDLAARLGTFGREHRVTPATLIHAAWAVVLTRYCGRDDVIFGGVMSGRDHEFDGADDIVGVFINNLPVRVRLDPDLVLTDWLTEFQMQLAGMRQYFHVPLSTVHQCSGLPRDVPLFESFVDVTNYPMRKVWGDFGDVKMTNLRVSSPPPYPLALVGVGGELGWRLRLACDPARFTPVTASRLAGLVTAMLRAIVDDPRQRLADLPAWPHGRPLAELARCGPPVEAMGGATPADPEERERGPAIPLVRAAESQHGRPADPLVEVITGVWAGVLETGPEKLDGSSGFFDLGGHSLLAIKLVSRIRSSFKVDFTIKDLFAAPTVAGCATAVRSALAGDPDDSVTQPIPRAPRDMPILASFAQERLWFVDQVTGLSRPNCALLAPRIMKELDLEAMRQALTSLVARHEVLRTRVQERDGRPVQVIRPPGAFPLTYRDLSCLPLGDAELAARTELERSGQDPIDLGTDLPLRACLLKLAPADYVLGLCVHHAAFDGWSLAVLYTELEELYQATVEHRPPQLPELPVQYADYSVWQRDRLSGSRLDRLLDYWRRYLAGAPDTLDLAPHSPVPRSSAGLGASYEVFLPPGVTMRLKHLAAEENCTLFTVLLAVYAELLGRRSGQRDIVVGVPVAGRTHQQLEGLIGFFVNVLPVRVDLGRRESFHDLVRQVRQVSLDALAHEELPFEKLVGVLSPSRDAEKLPLVQVGLTFQNLPSRKLEAEFGVAPVLPVTHVIPRFQFHVNLYERNGGVQCEFTYDIGCYDQVFAEQFGAEFLDIARDAVGRMDRPLAGSAIAGSEDATISVAHDAASQGMLRAMRRPG
jgi:non-ribosomal peptide synthetase component F/acyl carrier protein